MESKWIKLIMVGGVLLILGRIVSLIYLPESSTAFSWMGSYKAVTHLFLGLLFGLALDVSNRIELTCAQWFLFLLTFEIAIATPITLIVKFL